MLSNEQIINRLYTIMSGLVPGVPAGEVRSDIRCIIEELAADSSSEQGDLNSRVSALEEGLEKLSEEMYDALKRSRV